ncbi:SHOCT domain-containing protein [Natronococcus amylolyticus]|uniref:SHOCT domain-containing protein n=1 Tax=Natronococcus amylolyticus TaxID=44470 RepID=UPI00308406AC
MERSRRDRVARSPVVAVPAGGDPRRRLPLYGVLVDSSSRRSDPALEALRVAYARGELSDEEFEKRRDRLRGEDERP